MRIFLIEIDVLYQTKVIYIARNTMVFVAMEETFAFVSVSYD